MAIKTINPTDQELISVIGTWNTVSAVEADGYRFREKYDMERPELGETVVIHSHGRYRRGIVVAVGLTNAKVALTTPTAASDSATHGYDLQRVKGKPVPFYLVGRHVDTKIPVDVCGCTRNPIGHTVAEHPTEPAPVEPMTTEDVSRIFDVPAELIETAPDNPLQPTTGSGSADCAEHGPLCPHPAKCTPAEEPEPVATQPLPPVETAPAGAGSSVVTVLEKVWNQIRANHSELPEVVIVTGSGMIGPARWGHFRANGWTERAEKEAAVSLVLGEMFVAGETLARGAAHTLETMLHEAAHVLAKVRDIKDTSRQNRWHNQKFRTLAEELGLEYAKASAHPQIGFSEVTLTPGTTEEYAEVIEELDKAIRLTVALPEFLRAPTEGDDQEKGSGESMGHHGGRRPRTGVPAPNSNNVKATCGCEEPRIIRASRKVLEGARITCEECGEAFMDRS